MVIPVVVSGGICDHIRMVWKRRVPRSFLPSVAALAVVAGCTPAAPQVVTHTLHRPLTGPCPTDDSVLGRGEFGPEVTSFTATVIGPRMSAPVAASGETSVVLEDVPPGEDRIFALYGVASGQARWRGVSAPTSVVAGEAAAVEVVMAAVADVTCARSTGGSRAFHTATPLDDGTVLLVGGAGDMADASAVCNAECLRATATDTAAIYDPRTGALKPVGRLTSARMFHTAAKLPDGRVVISGGTAEAFFRAVDTATTPFPVVPTRPLATIEVYDPEDQSFSASGADPGGARVFAAATTTLDGAVIITGGIPGEAIPHNLGNALSTTTVCSGATLQCIPGPPLARARAGHMIFSIDPEGVFIWGGSVDISNDGFQMEHLPTGDASFKMLTVAGMQATRNVFFAAGTRYLDFRFLAAGGLFRRADGTFSAVDAENNNLAARAYVFDISAGANGGLTPPMNLQSGRIFASAAPLPDGASAIVVGGFSVPANINGLTWEAADNLELYDEETLQMLTISVGGEPRTLRQARAGVTATGLGDGTVVLVGGYADNAVASTAEVFADIKTPPQAAGFQ
jgi:hypothetical protein